MKQRAAVKIWKRDDPSGYSEQQLSRMRKAMRQRWKRRNKGA